MPTAYTARVHDGSATTLEDYMRDCARAFLWEYRDMLDWNDPLPTEPIVRAQCLTEAIANEQKALADIHTLEGLTLADCAAAAQKEFDDAVASAARSNGRNEDERATLQAMHDKVAAWTPPAPLSELKEFMIEQLHTSGLKHAPYVWSKPDAPMPAQEWRDRERERRQAYHARTVAEVAKQRASLDNATRWLNALHAELARGPSTAPSPRSNEASETGDKPNNFPGGK